MYSVEAGMRLGSRLQGPHQVPNGDRAVAVKTIRAADVDYGPDEIEALRKEMIFLRDHALKQNDFAWSVKLSHVIALMAAFKESLENG